MNKGTRKAQPPKVFVVSAPSGTGKTTLNRRLIKEHDSVEMSVSYTARKPREGEVDGVDYHFVTTERFRKLIDQGQMLEYAEVFGTLYGTSLAEIHRIEAAGKVAMLEIDVQGWRQARKNWRAPSPFLSCRPRWPTCGNAWSTAAPSPKKCVGAAS